MVFCKECGKQLSDNVLFCSECGTKVESKLSRSKENSKSVESSGVSANSKKDSVKICGNCDNKFVLDDELKNEYESKGYASFDCPHCNEEVELKKASVKRNNVEASSVRIIERVIAPDKKKLSFWEVLAKFIIALFIVALLVGGVIFVVALLEGSFDDIARGSGIGHIDPCEREKTMCYRECGDGHFGGFCKDSCTVKYNLCRRS